MLESKLHKTLKHWLKKKYMKITHVCSDDDMLWQSLHWYEWTGAARSHPPESLFLLMPLEFGGEIQRLAVRLNWQYLELQGCAKPHLQTSFSPWIGPEVGHLRAIQRFRAWMTQVISGLQRAPNSAGIREERVEKQRMTVSKPGNSLARRETLLHLMGSILWTGFNSAFISTVSLCSILYFIQLPFTPQYNLGWIFFLISHLLILHCYFITFWLCHVWTKASLVIDVLISGSVRLFYASRNYYSFFHTKNL